MNESEIVWHTQQTDREKQTTQSKLLLLPFVIEIGLFVRFHFGDDVYDGGHIILHLIHFAPEFKCDYERFRKQKIEWL